MDGITENQPPAPTLAPDENVLDAYSARHKILLLLGTLATVALFVAGATLLRVPAHRGFSASLLQQPNWFLAILGTGLIFLVSVLVASLVTWRVHADAGLFCAAVGLAVVSARGGPMRFVLFDSAGRQVFLSLASEILVLAALLALGWLIVEHFFDAGAEDAVPGEIATPGNKVLCTAVQVVVMVLLMLLLSRSDAKAQSLASVGMSSLLAAMAAHWFFPASPSPWVWSGPLIVGAFGYVMAYLRGSGIEIGHVSGTFAPLARPLPLDYASLGVAGALMGYWSSQRWHRREAAAKHMS